eukprot:NODE_506_length_6690_cov_0.762858.p5 type:complete len:169 gc:universal NODE_506_length_6690_cov_0.762858:2587-2081(-)
MRVKNYDFSLKMNLRKIRYPTKPYFMPIKSTNKVANRKFRLSKTAKCHVKVKHFPKYSQTSQKQLNSEVEIVPFSRKRKYDSLSVENEATGSFKRRKINVTIFISKNKSGIYAVKVEKKATENRKLEALVFACAKEDMKSYFSNTHQPITRPFFQKYKRFCLKLKNKK